MDGLLRAAAVGVACAAVGIVVGFTAGRSAPPNGNASNQVNQTPESQSSNVQNQSVQSSTEAQSSSSTFQPQQLGEGNKLISTTTSQPKSAADGVAEMAAACSVLEGLLADHPNNPRLKRVLTQTYKAMKLYSAFLARGSRMSSTSSEGDEDDARSSTSTTESLEHYFSAEEDEDAVFIEQIDLTATGDSTEDIGHRLSEVQQLKSILKEVKEEDILALSLSKVRSGLVRCRKDRTSVLECEDTTDFLCRLDCVRTASTLMLSHPQNRQWFLQTGRDVITRVLIKGGESPDAFNLAYDEMLSFLQRNLGDGAGFARIENELEGRRVVCLSFFDTVLDFILLDAFDDLKKPPQVILDILGNTWIPQVMKRKAIQAAVWSLMSKRSNSADPDGFLIRFYGIMKCVTPTLACGLLGCADDEFVGLCRQFKSIVLEYCVQLFAKSDERFRSHSHLATVMFEEIQQYTNRAMHLLQ